MSTQLVEKLRKRTIKNFLDIIILTQMKYGSISGYDVIGFIQKRFGVLQSSGTVYSALYSMERDGYVKGVSQSRKRIYKLTEKGEQNIELITKTNYEIEHFIKHISLLSINPG
jgi:DNA-binding PadR family transcriptional regulator